MISRKMFAWVCDYIILKPDGKTELGTASFSAPDIFAAADKAKDLIGDYNLQNPEESARVWDIGLIAEFGPEELFEEDDE